MPTHQAKKDRRPATQPDTMSRFDAATGVYGLITGTIAVIDASIKIWDAVQDKFGVTKELRKVAAHAFHPRAARGCR